MGASLDREPIAAALAARLTALCPSLKGVRRKWIPVTDLDGVDQPLAIVSEGSQSGQIFRGKPAAWTITFPVTLYCRAAEGDDTPPSTLLNALTKEIEDALERQSNEPVTDATDTYATNLGLSCVVACRMTSVETDEGILTPQAWAQLAIEVVAVPK
jgi:hypothetical protein